MAVSSNSSFVFEENLTHRVRSTISRNLPDSVMVYVVMSIGNVLVNKVELSNGEILKVGNQESIDLLREFEFPVIISLFSEEAKRRCRSYILEKLKKHEVERSTVLYLAPRIYSYVLELAESNRSSDAATETKIFEIRGSLVVTKEETLEEETVLGGVKKVIFEGKESRCAICLEKVCAGCECAVTPCSHVFHCNCILPWLVKDERCPMCRTILRHGKD